MQAAAWQPRQHQPTIACWLPRRLRYKLDIPLDDYRLPAPQIAYVRWFPSVEALQAAQQASALEARSEEGTEFCGVREDRSAQQAYITVDGVNKILGQCGTKEEAGDYHDFGVVCTRRFRLHCRWVSLAAAVGGWQPQLLLAAAGWFASRAALASLLLALTSPPRPTPSPAPSPPLQAACRQAARDQPPPQVLGGQRRCGPAGLPGAPGRGRERAAGVQDPGVHPGEQDVRRPGREPGRQPGRQPCWQPAGRQQPAGGDVLGGVQEAACFEEVDQSPLHASVH